MNPNAYPIDFENYIANRDIYFLQFTSKGNEEIDKGIAYNPVGYPSGRYYNLGFGDLIYDDLGNITGIDDKVEDNNGDVKLVFSTVVSTLPGFFAIHPHAKVHVRGSNQQRGSVYRGLIQRYYPQVKHLYHFEGSQDGRVEVFIPETFYDFILISKK